MKELLRRRAQIISHRVDPESGGLSQPVLPSSTIFEREVGNSAIGIASNPIAGTRDSSFIITFPTGITRADDGSNFIFYLSMSIP